MTGQELITELGSKGFALFLSGGRIGYRYTGEGEPDRKRVIPILEELRQKRNEILGLLISRTEVLDKYTDLFGLALAEVTAQDPRGVSLRRVQQDSTRAWAEIQAAEDEVNNLWKLAQKGRMVWEEYRLAVRKWKDKFSQTIQEQREKSC